MPTNLYEGVDEFRLIDDDNVVIAEAFRLIDEPVGFGELSITLKRDPKDGGGVNFEFGDAETPLSFDNSAGKELIEQIIDITGSDSNISIEFYNDGILRYRGALVVSSMNRQDDVVSFNVQRIDFNDKFRTRIDSDIDLEKTTNFDGDPITPNIIDFILHSRLVRLQAQSSVTDDFLSIWPLQTITVGPITYGPTNFPRFINTFDGVTDRFFYMPGLVVTIGGAETYFEYQHLMFAEDQDVVIDHPDTIPYFFGLEDTTPLDSKFFILRNDAVFASDLELEWNFNFEVRSFDSGEEYDLFYDLVVTDEDDNIVSSTQLFTLNMDFGVQLVYPIVFSGTTEINIESGHKVYLYFRFEPIVAGTTLSVGVQNFNAASLNIQQDTFQVQSITRGNFLPIVIDKALEYITGNQLALETSYFQHKGFSGASSDGCGGLDFITTGNSIRGFDKAVTVNMRDLLDFVIARYGAGFAIYENAGVQKLLLEKSSFFFQDKKIMTVEAIENPPIRRINRELLVNQIKVGYEKFARTNEVGTIDGFNTQLEYQTPIVKDKKKANFISPLVADGAEIERLRRQGIKTAGTQSDEKDDDVFVVRAIRVDSSLPFQPDRYENNSDRMSVVRDNVNNRITINGLIILNLQVGDKIVQTGKTTVAITGNIETDFDNNLTRFSAPTVENGEFFDDFYFTDASDQDKEDIFYTERVENFDNINLEEPFSEYNIRHSPTQFLIHNFYTYGSSLIKKSGTDLIRFLFRKNETILEKSFESASCGLTTDIINENQDFELNDLRSYNPTLFTEYIYEIKTRMSFSDLIRLKEALRNESSEDINYGYIDFEDIDGQIIQAYPFSVEYMPVSEEVTIIAWEKNN